MCVCEREREREREGAFVTSHFELLTKNSHDAKGPGGVPGATLPEAVELTGI